ncbi:MAG: N-6 DNA methylase, partial [Bacteroidales bacterium]
WDTTKTFYDPMCGSGTLLMEAAMLASNIPAAYYRQGFAFQHWNDYDANLWREIKEDAAKQIHDPECEIYGSDISAQNISTAELNIRYAKLHKDIELRQGDFFSLDPPDTKGGFIVCNPPYGERIQLEDIMNFYKQIGDTLKQKYKNYEAWFISSDIEALKNVGLRASRRIEVFNGPLECKFYRFELYEGSKKQKAEITELELDFQESKEVDEVN